MVRSALAGACLAVALGLGLAEGPAGSDDDLAVRELVANYAAAREARDAAEIRKLFTGDADQLVSSGEWRKGREVLVEGMLGSSSRNPGQRTLTVESVRFASADVAIADARYVIKGRGGNPDRRMWSAFVCSRSDSGWRITAIRNMLPAPRR